MKRLYMLWLQSTIKKGIGSGFKAGVEYSFAAESGTIISPLMSCSISATSDYSTYITT